MTGPWEHDWRVFVAERLEEFGYTSLRDFARGRPSATFRQLAEELGSGQLAPVQVQEMLKVEAETNGTLGEYLRDSLVRYLQQHVPNGLRRHGEWALILALGSWAGSTGAPLQSQAGRIAKAIKNLGPEYAEWEPSGPQDETLDRIFRSEGL